MRESLPGLTLCQISPQSVQARSRARPPACRRPPDCGCQTSTGRLAVADALEATIDQSLKKAEALRQSILQKAFRGELVHQEKVGD